MERLLLLGLAKQPVPLIKRVPPQALVIPGIVGCRPPESGVENWSTAQEQTAANPSTSEQSKTEQSGLPRPRASLRPLLLATHGYRIALDAIAHDASIIARRFDDVVSVSTSLMLWVTSYDTSMRNLYACGSIRERPQFAISTKHLED